MSSLEIDEKKNPSNETFHGPPKLGVYRSSDGSIYSLPEEIENLLLWIKKMSREHINKEAPNKDSLNE